jgi:aspartate/methionine/tyrosine aminotransferase
MADRLRGIPPTVFSEMSALAVRTGALNLGQGFPDQDGPSSAVKVAVEHDLVVITDEVYEHLVYEDHEHVPLSTLPGMWERTISLSSAGKTFSFTGWKVGWATGPADLAAR